MQTQSSPWRAWRETIPGLTMNEVARRSGISSGRLSIIERGVTPTDDEAAKLRSALIAALDVTPDQHECPLTGCGVAFTTDEALTWHMGRVHEQGPAA